MANYKCSICGREMDEAKASTSMYAFHAEPDRPFTIRPACAVNAEKHLCRNCLNIVKSFIKDGDAHRGTGRTTRICMTAIGHALSVPQSTVCVVGHSTYFAEKSMADIVANLLKQRGIEFERTRHEITLTGNHSKLQFRGIKDIGNEPPAGTKTREFVYDHFLGEP